MLKSILFVGLGSFVGGSLRYVVGRWLPAFTGHGFPYATLAVNLVGCLLIGFFLTSSLEKHHFYICLIINCL